MMRSLYKQMGRLQKIWKGLLAGGAGAVAALAAVNAAVSRDAPEPETGALGGEEGAYEWEHGSVFYRSAGAETAPPVVFVHGVGAGARSFMWRRNFEPLSADFRTYAVDLLGFGYSDKPPNAPYSAELYVAPRRGLPARARRAPRPRRGEFSERGLRRARRGRAPGAVRLARPRLADRRRQPLGAARHDGRRLLRPAPLARARHLLLQRRRQRAQHPRLRARATLLRPPLRHAAPRRALLRRQPPARRAVRRHRLPLRLPQHGHPRTLRAPLATRRRSSGAGRTRPTRSSRPRRCSASTGAHGSKSSTAAA